MFVFGDIVENGWASDDNPQKRGFVVRATRQSIELTNGKGDFWKFSIGPNNRLTKIGHCPVSF